MKIISAFICFILFSNNNFSIDTIDLKTKPHHTSEGFKNPFEKLEEKNFSDMIKWRFFERDGKKQKQSIKETQFETITNDGKKIRENNSLFSITWIGHDTMLVQLDGVNILTDPIWSVRASPVSFAGPERYVLPTLAMENLPVIDVILISHNHYDHMDEATIKKLGNTPLYIVPLGLGKILSEFGIDHFIELDWLDEYHYKNIRFICMPAQHFSMRSMFDKNKTLWAGWAAFGKKESFYFMGDTGYFNYIKKLGEVYGPFTVIMAPVGAYKPEWFMSSMHTNPEEAIQSFLDLHGDYFLPIHWKTFPMADDTPEETKMDLEKAIKKHNIKAHKILMLHHGETRFVIKK